MFESAIVSLSTCILVIVFAMAALDEHIKRLVSDAMRQRCGECDRQGCLARIAEFKKSKIQSQSVEDISEF